MNCRIGIGKDAMYNGAISLSRKIDRFVKTKMGWICQRRQIADLISSIRSDGALSLPPVDSDCGRCDALYRYDV